MWERVDQSEDELTKMSTNWPNNEYELTKWVRFDQIDEYKLTKMRMSWLEYELTWVRVDWEPNRRHAYIAFCENLRVSMEAQWILNKF